MKRWLVFLAIAGCGNDVGGGDMAMTCSDGVRDGDESDVDCGGGCVPCGAGRTCNGGGDCASGFCTNTVCDAASCSDGTKNGGESDVDCGGGCMGCAQGKACHTG